MSREEFINELKRISDLKDYHYKEFVSLVHKQSELLINKNKTDE